MSVTDKQILGSNLCNIECTEKNNIIHPETCVNQVLIGNGSTVNLPAWFDGDTDPEVHHGSFGDYSNMLAWLEANYPNSYTLPSATASRLGGIKVGNYLTIDNGVLSVNISELNIPTINSIANKATFDKYGVIKLGNDSPLISNFSNDSITGETSDNTDFFPVRLDSYNRAGIAIPNSLFTQVQTDWNQNNTSAADFIKNKPGIFSVGNNGLVPYPTEANNSKFLSAQGTWETIHTYTAGTNITIEGDTISATDTTYNVFEGTDGINDGTTGLVPAPTTSDVDKYLSSDGTWKAVADPNLKNHKVINKTSIIEDEYHNNFYAYKVICNLSEELLTIINKEDFKRLDTDYAHSLNLTGTVQWSRQNIATNKTIGLLYMNSIACKGMLKITITSSDTNIAQSYFMGFVADTPPHEKIGIFTNLDWNLTVKQETVGQAGTIYCYLHIPNDFVGDITVEGLGGAYASGTNISAFYYESGQINYYSLQGSASTTGQFCNDTSAGSSSIPVYRSSFDAAVSQVNELQIEDLLYDNEINDAVIHNLVVKLSRLEALVYNIINQNNNF